MSQAPPDDSGSQISIPDWIYTPERFIRGVIFGTVLSGIGSLLTPVFSAISLLLLGSEPGAFGAENEVWGLADLPAVLFGLVGDVVSTGLTLLFGAYASVIEAAIPQIPGPFEGIIAAVVAISILAVVVRIGLPTLQAGLEAIPVVGGPLSTLIEELRE